MACDLSLPEAAMEEFGLAKKTADRNAAITKTSVAEKTT
jgi:hypothetical protein